MNYIYYYDRIRIHSSVHYLLLRQLIDTKELRNHCSKIVIDKPNNVLKFKGYLGKIELFQATDEAIRMLQQYNIDRHTISYIEIARDKICNNSLESDKLRGVFQRNRYLKWGKGAFSIEDTEYLGKIYGIRRDMYVRCYIPDEDNIKFNNKNVVHVEFSIYRWKTIKAKLNISSIYDLSNAEHYYKSLSDKFIVRGTLNQNRIHKHFKDVNVSNVKEFIPVLSDKKEFIRFLKNRNAVHRILRRRLRGRILHKLTSSEVLIVNQGAGYWVIPNDGPMGLI